MLHPAPWCWHKTRPPHTTAPALPAGNQLAGVTQWLVSLSGEPGRSVSITTSKFRMNMMTAPSSFFTGTTSTRHRKQLPAGRRGSSLGQHSPHPLLGTPLPPLLWGKNLLTQQSASPAAPAPCGKLRHERLGGASFPQRPPKHRRAHAGRAGGCGAVRGQHRGQSACRPGLSRSASLTAAVLILLAQLGAQLARGWRQPGGAWGQPGVTSSAGDGVAPRTPSTQPQGCPEPAALAAGAAGGAGAAPTPQHRRPLLHPRRCSGTRNAGGDTGA